MSRRRAVELSAIVSLLWNPTEAYELLILVADYLRLPPDDHRQIARALVRDLHPDLSDDAGAPAISSRAA